MAAIQICLKRKDKDKMTEDNDRIILHSIIFSVKKELAAAEILLLESYLLTYLRQIQEDILPRLKLKVLWQFHLHKGCPRHRIIPSSRPDVNHNLPDNPMAVNALKHEDRQSGNQPLVEVRIPIVHTVNEEERVEHDHPDPVDEPEGDETNERTQGLDAAQPHDGKDDEYKEPCDGGEDVCLNALPEGRVEDGVQPEGTEVSEDMHHRPDQDSNGDGHMEESRVFQRKQLQQNTT